MYTHAHTHSHSFLSVVIKISWWKASCGGKNLLHLHVTIHHLGKARQCRNQNRDHVKEHIFLACIQMRFTSQVIVPPTVDWTFSYWRRNWHPAYTSHSCLSKSAAWACAVGTFSLSSCERWCRDTWLEISMRRGQRSRVRHLSQWDLGKRYINGPSFLIKQVCRELCYSLDSWLHLWPWRLLTPSRKGCLSRVTCHLSIINQENTPQSHLLIEVFSQFEVPSSQMTPIFCELDKKCNRPFVTLTGKHITIKTITFIFLLSRKISS